jgi:xylulokinase
MYFIGIDLGTSAVKLLLMDEIGKIHNSVNFEYPIYFPHPGWSEQDPNDWYVNTIKGIKLLLENFDSKMVKGIGIAGQMHGLVVLDKEDRILRNAILWNDGRTKLETEYLNTVIGKDELSKNTGNIAFAGFTAPKLLWMRENERDLFDRIDKIMLPKDYLLYKFTNIHATDYSDASGTLLLDVENKCWSKDMLKICHILEEQLPKLHESTDIIGALNSDLVKELGLLEDVILVAGAGDNAAAAIGSGTIGPGKCNISIGTSGTVFISNDKFTVDKNNALHSFAHADGKYHLMGCMLSAASCNKWWSEEILKTSDYNSEQKNILKLGENNVLYLPYLMGERSPHNDENARAAFIGMSMDTGREEMTQAVLEGVSFGLRDLIEVAKAQGINIEKSGICGGGAKSDLWKRIIANVLNLELEIPLFEEGPGYGAAILAAVGAGVFSDIDEGVGKTVKIRERINPEKELVEKYNIKYERFKELYPLLKGWF